MLLDASSVAVRATDTPGSRSAAHSDANTTGHGGSEDEKSSTPAAQADASPDAVLAPSFAEKPVPAIASGEQQTGNTRDDGTSAESARTISDLVPTASLAEPQQGVVRLQTVLSAPIPNGSPQTAAPSQPVSTTSKRNVSQQAANVSQKMSSGPEQSLPLQMASIFLPVLSVPDRTLSQLAVAPSEQVNSRMERNAAQQVVAPFEQTPSAAERTGMPEKQLNTLPPIEGSDTEADRITSPTSSPNTSGDGAAFAEAVLASADGFALPADFLRNSNSGSDGDLQDTGNASQLMIKPAQSKISGLAQATNSASVSAQDMGKSGTVPSSDTSSSGAQIGAQSGQHASTDVSQPVAVAIKPTDNLAIATSALQSHIVPREITASHSAPNGTDAAPRQSDVSASLASDQARSGDTAVTPGINTARLIQSMGETEMRVGMRSSEFGDISIRTSVSQQQMVAQISVDHGDLGTAISAHIPSIQEKLGNEYGLHASIQLNQGGASFSDERGQSSQRDQKAFVRSAPNGGPAAAVVETDKSTLRVPPTVNDGYRLDIRA
jgi:hypothetical protein